MKDRKDERVFLQNLKAQLETELWRVAAWYEIEMESLRWWIALLEEMLAQRE